MISIFRTVKCKIIFMNREVIHDFSVLPDEEAIVPLLIGRDLFI